MMRPTIPQLLLVAAGAAACAVLLSLSAPRWRALETDVRGGPTAPVVPPGRDATREPTVATVAPTLEEVRLRLVAARGDCWLVIRSGSAQGPIRFAGILQRGAAAQARGRRLWVSLGAAANLDATLNGRRLRSFPTGTIDVVVTPDGVSQAPSAGDPAPEVTPS